MLNQTVGRFNLYDLISMSDSEQRATEPPVRWERAENVGLITLDRPAQLNALNVQLSTGLHVLIDQLDHAEAVAPGAPSTREAIAAFVAKRA
jgi:hypothetical protein